MPTQNNVNISITQAPRVSASVTQGANVSAQTSTRVADSVSVSQPLTVGATTTPPISVKASVAQPVALEATTPTHTTVTPTIGQVGPQGVQGEKGDKGDQGIQGIQGVQGVKGDTGASINDADFVGNDIVFTKDDTSQVTLVDAKTALKGDQGIQGIQGIQGEAGVVDPGTLTDATLINDTTNTDTYAGATNPTISVYELGLVIHLKVTNANTGASTLNVCSLGAKSIKKNVTEDLAAGEIKAGQILPLVYDGTNFQVVGGGGGGGGDILAVQVFS